MFECATVGTAVDVATTASQMTRAMCVQRWRDTIRDTFPLPINIEIFCAAILSHNNGATVRSMKIERKNNAQLSSRMHAHKM